METSDLKKKIKQFGKDMILLKQMPFKTGDEQNIYYASKEVLQSQLKRLYGANDTFEGLDKSHVLILLRANLTLRAIPLHQFGINLRFEKLI